MVATHSWHRPPGQGSSEFSPCERIWPESELCSRPYPEGEQSKSKLAKRIKIPSHFHERWRNLNFKTKICENPQISDHYITFPLLSDTGYLRGGHMDHFRAAPVPAVPESWLCVLWKLPLSQGSVIPTDPGRNSPAARICKHRLKHGEALEEHTSTTYSQTPTPKQHAVPVCHARSQRLSGGVVPSRHSVPTRKSGKCAIKWQFYLQTN